MKLENQVCNLELAKKLKELGVKHENYFWWTGDSESGFVVVGPYDKRTYRGAENHPAFTVAELGECLPTKVGEKRLRIWFVKNPRQYCVAYVDLEKFIADTEADARAKMVIYLIENNLMEKL